MKRGRRAAAATRRAPPRRPRWIVGAGVGIAVAAVAVAWWTIGRPRAPRVAAPPDLQAAGEAYRRARDLVAAGRYRESIPGFRTAVEARPQDWDLQHDHASALLNTVHEGRSHLGHTEFVVRSSYERVAMLREGLAALDRAAQLAPNPRALAQVHRTRAQILKAWGLGWNAFESYRASEWSDTTWKESRSYADAFMLLMENPTRAGD